MKILVIDGQGGRFGRQIIEGLKPYTAEHELIAVGTNALATSAMLKAGAVLAATGENAVCVNAADADPDHRPHRHSGCGLAPRRGYSPHGLSCRTKPRASAPDPGQPMRPRNHRRCQLYHVGTC